MDRKSIINLASRFLNEYSDELANHGCNDFDLKTLFPALSDRIEFVKAYHKWNGDLCEWENNGCLLDLPDFAVVSFISHLLKKCKF